MQVQDEAELERIEDEAEEFANLIKGSNFVRTSKPTISENVIIGVWELNWHVYKVYSIIKQYSVPIFAGMSGVLVTEQVDTKLMVDVCKLQGLGKKKVLEIVELLPYLHNTVLSKKIKREAGSGNERPND